MELEKHVSKPYTTWYSNHTFGKRVILKKVVLIPQILCIKTSALTWGVIHDFLHRVYHREKIMDPPPSPC